MALEYAVVQKQTGRSSYEVELEAFDTREEAEREAEARNDDPLCDAVTYYVVVEYQIDDK